MPNPLDYIRRQIAASIDRGPMPAVPPSPAPPSRTTRSTDGPVPRVRVVDTREVAPNARLAGNYASEPLADVIRSASTHGMPPDLALAMAIREQSSDLANPSLAGGDSFRNPLTLNRPEPWMRQEPSLVEPAIMHAVERASAVAPAGRERQVQAFQGLGKQPTGYNERFLGEANPYAKAVEEIRQRVVAPSAALQALLRTVQPLPLDPTGYSSEKIQAIADTMTRRTRNPGLWK
jgi:hypothetical protein